MTQTLTSSRQHCKLPDVEDKLLSLIASDTDVLILLIYHFNASMCSIFMQYETSGRNKVVAVSIGDIWNKMTVDCVPQLLCAHAMTGCDTTSALFRRGKVGVWRLLSSSTVTLMSLSNTMSNADASHDDVLTDGLKLLVIIYGGKPNSQLNQLRYTHYMNMLASSLTPRPETLPPTENAAKFHIFRAHCQSFSGRHLGQLDWTQTRRNGLESH